MTSKRILRVGKGDENYCFIWQFGATSVLMMRRIPHIPIHTALGGGVGVAIEMAVGKTSPSLPAAIAAD